MAIIKSPVEGYSGVVVGVQFTDGVAETDREAALSYFRRQGYTIEAGKKGSSESSGKASGEPSAADLKARAKELGLSTSGKKADLEARIAEHKAKTKSEAPPTEHADGESDGTAGDASGENPPAAGDGAGSVREV